MQTLEVITIQNPDSGQDRDKKNPDRQTPDSILPKQPDRIRTAERTEIDKIWTDRHRTGFSGKSGQKRDTDSAVRRLLVRTLDFLDFGLGFGHVK